MNHIRFESAREVCFFPKLLGLETIIVDYSQEICKDCMAIIMNYNDRINNYELALSIPRKPIKKKPAQVSVRTATTWVFFASVWPWIAAYIYNLLQGAS